MLPKSVSAFIIILALGLALPGADPLYGAQEDVALFQEALSPYGQWLNLGQHGPVWRPTQVARSWRPYTNGRWVPTQEGYVFETEEPWGWATYHYGNWLPTQEHGWVWVPGRTWYPHTVNWRSNDDNVGWAPVPPDYGGSDSYSAGGYADSYGAAPGLNSYGSPPSSWVFTRATDFLLGWDQPYTSRYSYANAGLLLGPQYIPVVYERTVLVNNFVTPSYAPRACYNWGPPVTYLTKVTNIKNIDLERRGRERRLHHLRNVMPPERVSRRHPAWREVLPVTEETRQRHIRRVAAAGRLNRPDAIPAPRSLSRPSTPVAAGVGTPGVERLGPPAPAAAARVPGHDLERRRLGRPIQELGRQTPAPERLSPPPRLMTGTDPARGTTPATPAAPGTVAPVRPKREVARPRPPGAIPRGPLQPSPDQQAGAPTSPRENRLDQAQPPRGRHQLPYPEQALRHRQQQRLEMEGRPRAYPNQPAQQAPGQQQVQMEQQRRQAEMQQRQQQAEMQRQQQRQQQALQEQQRQQARQQQLQMENQRRQAAMQQQQQAEVMRARQMQQQQQVVRQAPPPPAAPAPPPRQKKRENQ